MIVIRFFPFIVTVKLFMLKLRFGGQEIEQEIDNVNKLLKNDYLVFIFYIRKSLINCKF